MITGKLSCEHCKSDQLDDELMSIVNRVMIQTGLQLKANSGVRCSMCDKAAGGVPTSAHIPKTNGKIDVIGGISHALDIDLTGFGMPISEVRAKLFNTFASLGINRFGMMRTALHVDNDLTLPQNRIWDYY